MTHPADPRWHSAPVFHCLLSNVGFVVARMNNVFRIKMTMLSTLGLNSLSFTFSGDYWYQADTRRPHCCLFIQYTRMATVCHHCISRSTCIGLNPPRTDQQVVGFNYFHWLGSSNCLRFSFVSDIANLNPWSQSLLLTVSLCYVQYCMTTDCHKLHQPTYLQCKLTARKKNYVISRW